MIKTFAIKTFAAVTLATSLAYLGTAQAQVVVPPGQDFYATPIAHDMPTTMPQSKMTPPAPAQKANKKIMKKHGMMKKKMMRKKKM